MPVVYTLKQPLQLINSTGFNSTPTTDIYGTKATTVTFAIGQDVSSGSNIEFNRVTSTPPILIDNGIFKIDDGSITGSYTHTGNFTIGNNFTFENNLSIDGKLTGEKIQTELTQSTVIFKSGSTIFGNSTDDIHKVTGSLSTTSSIELNGYSVSGISNDINLTDSNASDLLTENALNKFSLVTTPEIVYLRKSFTKVGTFINTSTASFSAVTASSPSGLTSTSELDFMFFNNGMLIEYDALEIEQSASVLLLKVNNNSLGYELKSTDEIIGFGKFNS